LITHEIRQLVPLPNTYVSNTTDLIKKLKDTPTLPHYALAPLDIANLYANVPVNETRNIISSTLEQMQLNPQTRHALTELYDVVTQQNYFSNNAEILVQEEGLAMYAPTSGLLAEFFLQHPEHMHIPHLQTQDHKILPI